MMSLFKRLSTTLFSRIDQVVGEIENHDAVIQASLNDMRKKVAEAKVRLGQVHREKEQLEQQSQELLENVRRWQQRAVECADANEEKALECVSRSRFCEQKNARLRQAINQYAQTADKLGQDIESSEQHLGEMKQKLTLMRARQSTTSAISATSEMNNNVENQLDETFGRWEINISQTEMLVDQFEPTDVLERDFLAKEKEGDLRKELTRLLAKEEQK